LASSAPILYFKGSPDALEDDFSMIITDDFAAVDPKIPTIIKEGWSYIVDATPD